MKDKLKIVIVEDDDALSGLLSRKLARDGHSCECFPTAGKFMEWITANKADLVMLDLGLPDKDGEDVIEEMKTKGIDTPFIVVTGQGSETIAVNLLKKGARDYLVKNTELLDVLPSTIEMAWREITLERLLAQAREQIKFQNVTLTAVQDLSLDGIMVAKSDGEIISFNRKLLDLCGLELSHMKLSMNEVIAIVASKATGKDTLLDTIRKPSDVEINLSDVMVGERFLEVHSIPMAMMLGQESRIIGRIWYFRDVTTHKEAQKATEKAKYEAETHAKMKDYFFSMISHDVKTPLNSITGFSELLTFTELTESQKEYVDNIVESTSYLMTLVNDILDLSKIEHKAINLEITEFVLADSLDKCLNSFAQQAKAKGLTLLKDYAPDLPKTIIGDELRLRQVVNNLLGNSSKFTFKGSITLKVERRPGEMLAISIIDTGIGIKKEYQKFVFTPFTQESASGTRIYGGSGLGLAIVKHLVDIFGGTVIFDSEQGKGSTFTVTIPTKMVKPVREHVPLLS